MVSCAGNSEGAKRHAHTHTHTPAGLVCVGTTMFSATVTLAVVGRERDYTHVASCLNFDETETENLIFGLWLLEKFGNKCLSGLLYTKIIDPLLM